MVCKSLILFRDTASFIIINLTHILSYTLCHLNLILIKLEMSGFIVKGFISDSRTAAVYFCCSLY